MYGKQFSELKEEYFITWLKNSIGLFRQALGTWNCSL